MTDTLYLSRAKLREDASVGAIRTLLMPEGDDARVMANHRLIWSLFADSADRERDFLWREDGDGYYYFLSSRPPDDKHRLFDLHPAKVFAPELSPGDRLRFTLRANATRARKVEGSKRGKPQDVVMQAIHQVPKGPERAPARIAAVQSAGAAWLAKQGERCGFQLGTSDGSDPEVRVTGYRVWKPDSAARNIVFGVMDFDGELTVTDPVRFLDSLRLGFGRAKAFGCGLMLIKRS